MYNNRPRLSLTLISPSSAVPKDRPAFFVISFICLIGLALAWRIQVTYSPPIWVHLFIVLPTVLLACLLKLLNSWLSSGTRALTINRK